MWIKYNANPGGKSVGDCVIRAISTSTGLSWDEVYDGITSEGRYQYDMPSSNSVWGSYLKKHGFRRHIIPDTCPDCYSVERFCKDHPTGVYILALSGHVVAVIDGNYIDTWDSGNEVPIYYWKG